MSDYPSKNDYVHAHGLSFQLLNASKTERSHGNMQGSSRLILLQFKDKGLKWNLGESAKMLFKICSRFYFLIATLFFPFEFQKSVL